MSRWARKVDLHESESLFSIMEKRVPYQPYSQTSRAAAKAVAPKEGSYLWMVIDNLRKCGAHGSTDFEAIAALKAGWPAVENGYRSRRGKLVKSQKVCLAPFKRLSPNGLECDVWILKEFANG